MKRNDLQDLIVKYITNSITAKEQEELDLLLQNPENEAILQDFIETNYFIDHMMKAYKTERSKKILLDQIKKDKKRTRRKKILRVFKYAAVICLLLGLGYILKDVLSPSEGPVVPVTEQNLVTLELENGEVKVLSEAGSFSVMDASGETVAEQQGDKIVYRDAANQEALVYNTLNVPYGRKFKLELSDSTIIYLNAGSSLKYPVRFLAGQNREVYLTGEAFFDVTEDTQRPFLVTSEEMEIRVVGTKFNVSTYPEDIIKEVVLVEGAVQLSGSSKENKEHSAQTVLAPGIKGSFDTVEQNIVTEPVITSIYTSWIEGDLVFRNMAFGKILKKLERHYNVVIVNDGDKMDHVEFNASFSEMPLQKILDYFKSVYGIDYHLEGDQIIIE